MRFVILTLIFLFCSSTLFASVKTQHIARIIFTIGKVYRLHNKILHPLTRGERLSEGDYVITRSKSIALIKIENSDSSITSTIKVNEKSKVKIRIDRKIPMAHLSLGSVVVKVMSLDKKSKNLKLKVQSRVAALGIRGTEFFVYVSEKGGQVTSLREGGVEVNGVGSSEPMQLQSGYSTTTNIHQQLTKPRQFSWQQQINWNINQRQGRLQQPSNLISQVVASWNKYKQEQEYLYKQYIKGQKNKFNKFKQNNDKLKQKLFDS